jgi:hypothetical protein
MADPKKLARFTVDEVDGDYRMHVADDGGGTLELSVTREQLDVIVDTLDDLLALDDSADEVPGGRR